MQDSTPNLNTALVAAKKKIPAITEQRQVKIPTKSGRVITFTYAELEEISRIITPVLCEHGLAIVHQQMFFGEKLCLMTTLRHESGESVSSYFPLPVGYSDVKELGIQLAYGRRYNILCLLDISTVEPNSRDWEETKRWVAKEVRHEVKPPKKDEGSFLEAVSGVDSTRTISEAQSKRLYAIAHKNQFSEEEIKSVLQQYGFNSTRQIASTKYDEIVAHFQAPKSEKPGGAVSLSRTFQDSLSPEVTPQIDKALLRKEIASLIKRKKLTVEQAQDICYQEFGVKESKSLTDVQLLRLRDRLSLAIGV